MPWSGMRCILIIAFLAATLMASIWPLPVSANTGVIALSATSGVVGTGVTVSGTGFTPGSNYTVYFTDTPVVTGTVTTGGALSGATFDVPDFPRGARTVNVTTDASDTSNASAFTITSSIVLSSITGNVDDSITVTGHGFGAGLTVSVYFDSTILTSEKSSSSGKFTASITIPAAIAGTHTMKGTDTGGSSPTVSYIISPEIVINPGTLSVGSTITVSGTGFKGSSAISFYIDNSLISGTTVTSGATGSFTLNEYALPSLSEGSHTFTATDASSDSASAKLTVQQAIYLEPEKGSAGSTIAVSGTGFRAGKAIKITYGGSSVVTDPSTITTNAKGSFSAYFVVPDGSARTYTLTVTDGSLSASTAFTLAGSINPSPSSGIVGSEINLQGVNFSVGATVTISYDSIKLGTSRTDNSGVFAFSFKVPNSSGGDHTIICTDGIDTNETIFTVKPGAGLSPDTGVIGSNVIINGHGFKASATVVISYDGKTVGMASTDTGGSFTENFQIPASKAGEHSILIKDQDNSISVPFTVTAGVNLSLSNGSVDTEISLKGVGLNAGRQCYVQWDGNQIASGSTDNYGSVNLSFKVPAAIRGNHVLTITDGANVVKQQFTVNSAVVLSPQRGNVGDTITINGSGFAAGQAITVKYDSSEVSRATSDINGSFVTTFLAPVSLGGNHQVSVADQQILVVAGFVMDTSPPETPVLVLPADNNKASGETVFNWSAAADPSGVTYTLEVAADAAFSDILIEKVGLTAPGYTLSAAESLKSTGKKHPYYWRVKAIDAASNDGNWSDPQTFYVGLVLPSFVLYIIFGLALILVFLVGFVLGRRSGTAG